MASKNDRITLWEIKLSDNIIKKQLKELLKLFTDFKKMADNKLKITPNITITQANKNLNSFTTKVKTAINDVNKLQEKLTGAHLKLSIDSPASAEIIARGQRAAAEFGNAFKIEVQKYISTALHISANVSILPDQSKLKSFIDQLKYLKLEWDSSKFIIKLNKDITKIFNDASKLIIKAGENIGNILKIRTEALEKVAKLLNQGQAKVTQMRANVSGADKTGTAFKMDITRINKDIESVRQLQQALATNSAEINFRIRNQTQKLMSDNINEVRNAQSTIIGILNNTYKEEENRLRQHYGALIQQARANGQSTIQIQQDLQQRLYNLKQQNDERIRQTTLVSANQIRRIEEEKNRQLLMSEEQRLARQRELIIRANREAGRSLRESLVNMRDAIADFQRSTKRFKVNIIEIERAGIIKQLNELRSVLKTNQSELNAQLSRELSRFNSKNTNDIKQAQTRIIQILNQSHSEQLTQAKNANRRMIDEEKRTLKLQLEIEQKAKQEQIKLAQNDRAKIEQIEKDYNQKARQIIADSRQARLNLMRQYNDAELKLQQEHQARLAATQRVAASKLSMPEPRFKYSAEKLGGAQIADLRTLRTALLTSSQEMNSLIQAELLKMNSNKKKTIREGETAILQIINESHNKQLLAMKTFNQKEISELRTNTLRQLQIEKERHAQGMIDQQTYEQRRKELLTRTGAERLAMMKRQAEEEEKLSREHAARQSAVVSSAQAMISTPRTLFGFLQNTPIWVAASQSAQNYAGSLGNLGMALTRLGPIGIGVGVALAGLTKLFTESAEAAGKFIKKSIFISTLLDDFQEIGLETAMNRLRVSSMKTGSTIDDLQQSMYNIISAVPELANDLNAVANASELASKAAIGMGGSTDSASDALINLGNASGIVLTDIKNQKYVFDILANTMKLGKMKSGTELAKYISESAPTMRTVVADTKDMIAIIGAFTAKLTTSGVSIDEASTQIKNFAKELFDLKNQAEMADLGIQGFNYQLGQVTDWKVFLESMAEKGTKAIRVFDEIRASNAAKILTQDIKGTLKMIDALRDSGGTMEEMYKKMEKAQTPEKMKASWNDLLITVGDTSHGIVVGFEKIMTNIFDWWNNLLTDGETGYRRWISNVIAYNDKLNDQLSERWDILGGVQELQIKARFAPEVDQSAATKILDEMTQKAIEMTKVLPYLKTDLDSILNNEHTTTIEKIDQLNSKLRESAGIISTLQVRDVGKLIKNMAPEFRAAFQDLAQQAMDIANVPVNVPGFVNVLPGIKDTQKFKYRGYAEATTSSALYENIQLEKLNKELEYKKQLLTDGNLVSAQGKDINVEIADTIEKINFLNTIRVQQEELMKSYAGTAINEQLKAAEQRAIQEKTTIDQQINMTHLREIALNALGSSTDDYNSKTANNQELWDKVINSMLDAAKINIQIADERMRSSLIYTESLYFEKELRDDILMQVIDTNTAELTTTENKLQEEGILENILQLKLDCLTTTLDQGIVDGTITEEGKEQLLDQISNIQNKLQILNLTHDTALAANEENIIREVTNEILAEKMKGHEGDLEYEIKMKEQMIANNETQIRALEVEANVRKAAAVINIILENYNLAIMNDKNRAEAELQRLKGGTAQAIKIEASVNQKSLEAINLEIDARIRANKELKTTLTADRQRLEIAKRLGQFQGKRGEAGGAGRAGGRAERAPKERVEKMEREKIDREAQERERDRQRQLEEQHKKELDLYKKKLDAENDRIKDEYKLQTEQREEVLKRLKEEQTLTNKIKDLINSLNDIAIDIFKRGMDKIQTIFDELKPASLSQRLNKYFTEAPDYESDVKKVKQTITNYTNEITDLSAEASLITNKLGELKDKYYEYVQQLELANTQLEANTNKENEIRSVYNKLEQERQQQKSLEGTISTTSIINKQQINDYVSKLTQFYNQGMETKLQKDYEQERLQINEFIKAYNEFTKAYNEKLSDTTEEIQLLPKYGNGISNSILKIRDQLQAIPDIIIGSKQIAEPSTDEEMRYNELKDSILLTDKQIAALEAQKKLNDDLKNQTTEAIKKEAERLNAVKKEISEREKLITQNQNFIDQNLEAFEIMDMMVKRVQATNDAIQSSGEIVTRFWHAFAEEGMTNQEAAFQIAQEHFKSINKEILKSEAAYTKYENEKDRIRAMIADEANEKNKAALEEKLGQYVEISHIMKNQLDILKSMTAEDAIYAKITEDLGLSFKEFAKFGNIAKENANQAIDEIQNRLKQMADEAEKKRFGSEEERAAFIGEKAKVSLIKYEDWLIARQADQENRNVSFDEREETRKELLKVRDLQRQQDVANDFAIKQAEKVDSYNALAKVIDELNHKVATGEINSRKALEEEIKKRAELIKKLKEEMTDVSLTDLPKNLEEIQKLEQENEKKTIQLQQQKIDDVREAFAKLEQYSGLAEEVGSDIRQISGLVGEKKAGAATEEIGKTTMKVGKALLNSSDPYIALAGAVILGVGMLTTMIGKIVKAFAPYHKTRLDMAQEEKAVQDNILGTYQDQIDMLQKKAEYGDRSVDSAREELALREDIYWNMVAINAEAGKYANMSYDQLTDEVLRLQQAQRDAQQLTDQSAIYEDEGREARTQWVEDNKDLFESLGIDTGALTDSLIDGLSGSEWDKLIKELQVKSIEIPVELGWATAALDRYDILKEMKKLMLDEITAKVQLNIDLITDLNYDPEIASRMAERATEEFKKAIGEKFLTLGINISEMSEDQIKKIAQEMIGVLDDTFTQQDIDIFQRWLDAIAMEEEALSSVYDKKIDLLEMRTKISQSDIDYLNEIEADEQILQLLQEQLETAIKQEMSEEYILQLKVRIYEIQQKTNSAQDEQLRGLIEMREQLLRMARQDQQLTAIEQESLAQVEAKIRARLMELGVSPEEIERIITSMEIQRYEKGGFVNATPGKPILATVHGGEYVIPTKIANQLGRERGIEKLLNLQLLEKEKDRLLKITQPITHINHIRQTYSQSIGDIIINMKGENDFQKLKPMLNSWWKENAINWEKERSKWRG